MNHQPFEDWLFTAQDLTLEEETALQQHLKDCDACTRLAQAWQDLECRLQNAPLAAPQLGFAARWQSRQEADRQRLHHRQSLLLFTFSLAGAALLLGSLALLALPLLGSPKILLWTWLYRGIGVLTAAEGLREFGITFFQAVNGSIPLVAWVFLVGILCELAVLWVVSLRLLTNPRRVTE